MDVRLPAASLEFAPVQAACLSATVAYLLMLDSARPCSRQVEFGLPGPAGADWPDPRCRLLWASAILWVVGFSPIDRLCAMNGVVE